MFWHILMEKYRSPDTSHPVASAIGEWIICVACNWLAWFALYLIIFFAFIG